MFKRKETVILLVVTLGIVTLTLLQLTQIDFIYGIGQNFLYFVFLLTCLYSLYRVINEKRRISLFVKAKPILFAIILTGFLFLLSFFEDTDGGKKSTISGGVNHDIHFISFNLFADKTFKLINSGPFGGPIYRGQYSLDNDTLILKNDSLKHLYPSLTLVLRRENGKKYFEPLEKGSFDYRLYIKSNN